MLENIPHRPTSIPEETKVTREKINFSFFDTIEEQIRPSGENAKTA